MENAEEKIGEKAERLTEMMATLRRGRIVMAGRIRPDGERIGTGKESGVPAIVVRVRDDFRIDLVAFEFDDMGEGRSLSGSPDAARGFGHVNNAEMLSGIGDHIGLAWWWPGQSGRDWATGAREPGPSMGMTSEGKVYRAILAEDESPHVIECHQCGGGPREIGEPCGRGERHCSCFMDEAKNVWGAR